MSKEFTQKEIYILTEVASEVDEIYVEDRKGVSQTKYVMVVKDGTYDDFSTYDGTNDEGCFDIPIPEDLIGTWMMSHHCDLRYETLKDCIKGYDWVKCKQVDKVITVWEEV